MHKNKCIRCIMRSDRHYIMYPYDNNVFKPFVGVFDVCL